MRPLFSCFGVGAARRKNVTATRSLQSHFLLTSRTLRHPAAPCTRMMAQKVTTDFVPASSLGRARHVETARYLPSDCQRAFCCIAPRFLSNRHHHPDDAIDTESINATTTRRASRAADRCATTLLHRGRGPTLESLVEQRCRTSAMAWRAHCCPCRQQCRAGRSAVGACAERSGISVRSGSDAGRCFRADRTRVCGMCWSLSPEAPSLLADHGSRRSASRCKGRCQTGPSARHPARPSV